MRFELLRPETLPEASGLLVRYGEEARPLAGGTDLFVQLKTRRLRVPRLVDLRSVPGLAEITYRPGEGLQIGPLVTHARLATHQVVREKFTALAEACASVGSPQVRNLGTVGGNLCNASPAADSAPALLALGAVLRLCGPRGEREVPLAAFFQGPGRPALAAGELVRAVWLPEPAPGTVSTYLKLGRRQALEIAVAGVALAARRVADTWRDCRLALGAVAPTPLLAGRAAAELEGTDWGGPALRRAAQAAAGECSPISDQRASAAYRRDMVGVLTVRAANRLAGKEAGPGA
ncbi:MAG: xanthine dehydrogenase family protein subunit M [Armatimonadota bacterium]|nr:xanthine dehydrogenase family protein subunit M [Armatimonadota bacterium]